MDLNSVGGSGLAVGVLVLVTLCTKKERQPLETRTEDRCSFSGIVDNREFYYEMFHALVKAFDNSALYQLRMARIIG